MAIFPPPVKYISKFYNANDGYEYPWDDQSYYVNTTNTNVIATYTSGNISAYSNITPPKTQAELDLEWLKKEVNDICKGAFV